MDDRITTYQKAFHQVMAVKEQHRAQEEVIDELKAELKVIKEESFIMHTMRLILELDFRDQLSLYSNLQSPMKQTLYLIDVYYSIEEREECVDMDMECWERISLLLNEIEMIYFAEIGFPNNGDLYSDDRDEQVKIALMTFMGYWSNAVLSYEEQMLDKIDRYIRPYDTTVQSVFGFKIDDAIRFIAHLRQLNNNKLNEVLSPAVDAFTFYGQHPEEWRKLTKTFEERGIDNPEDWWYQPELSGMLETFKTNPGEVHLHDSAVVMDVEIEPESLKHLVEFFLYDKNEQKGKTTYYADKHHSETNPLIRLGEKFVCPINKFFFEGLYFRIDEMLKNVDHKYKKNKDVALEKKVKEVFQKFFPRETKIFNNYSVDGQSENDLLVILGTTCVVVEIKNCNFREPFRNPIQAYGRIKSDYKKAIQLGYKQCHRVEKVLMSNLDVDILDADDKKNILYRLKNKNIGDIWSIVVTDVKYGAIQTDLNSMLDREDDSLFPWSVCIDDLEVMFLLMRKILKGIAPARFLEFLDYRERFQGHIICFDELEMCGWYLTDREQFKEFADKELTVNTTPNMSNIFDAYYRIGLGFSNELDVQYKKFYSLPDYPKSFDMNEISLSSLQANLES